MIQEGLVAKRPFAGASCHDRLENIAVRVATSVFGVDHAILQAHFCSQAILNPGDPVLALDFRSGGHLTHGMSRNFSGRLYEFQFYGVDENGRIDYDDLEERAVALRPELIVCGSPSYPWRYDVARLRRISDAVGAKLMLDVSHEGGLIAGVAFECDLSIVDVATMSLDKTMRGRHGAAILCRAGLADRVDAAVHAGTQSSFPVARVSDAAKTLLETQTALFQRYAKRAIELAGVLAGHLEALRPASVVGGATEKHYLLLDTEKGLRP
ncbi:hypothetical protein [Rathayibacter toxicus]|uniref:hypothetical protein n=1 Tax=Rathayibacter toxicus TaxID=145458 RepID=UPI000CE8C759|nr:hypothetical protein [Rathayibacter toxicus]PPI55357.1 hypothetical protein C5D35_06590 [Rathayibacter toxicus]QOD11311.1 hypothetical protein BSG36_05070 [Rathayibacter toxicus]QWL28053.1 hypothetical protein E2R33_05075 [Rathayibacter toxicus]QWL32252.1 hypothetical protein E2R35_04940 [Rathayibacter toxicus]QWL34345.1 hypothetical protein E2R36_04940 [Rathayibacter toxicus]